MRAVNLLPREAIKQRKTLGQQGAPALVGAGLGVVVTGALALGFLHEAGAVSSAQKQLEAAKQVLAHTPKPPPVAVVQPDPNAALSGQQSALLSAVTTAVGARLAWDRILREFSLVLPDDVTVTSLNLTTPTVATPGATTTSTDVNIVGQTYSHDSVARLLARLALIPELSNVTLQSDTSSGASTSDTGTTTTVVAPISFTIVASVKLPAGATSLLAPPPVAAPAPVSTDTTGASS